MKILFVSSEVVPYSKTGGLADVSGTLPPAVASMGHEVRVVTPKYKTLKKEPADSGVDVDVSMGKTRRTVRLFDGELPVTETKSVPVTLTAQPDYFDRDELYATPSGAYEDNHERFGFFAAAALEVARALDFRPDIVHLNDWQSALAAVYLRSTLKDDPFFKSSRIVITVHNLGYQGLFDRSAMDALGLPGSLFIPEYLEFFGRINFLKGAMVFADAITTVSERYAEEIRTPEYGMGLDGVLRDSSDKLHGILNGVDYSEWNPKKDRFIAKPYTRKKISGKARCKEDLQRAFRLPKAPDSPLIGMVGRLTEQKGFDLVEAALPDLMIRDMQLVVLGTGDERFHRFFESVKAVYRKKLGVKLTYDNALAHKIEAGSDMFLMPSLYEPCGLNQMYSLKYGAAPIVRATGGLDDTVHESSHGDGTGFKFHNYTPRDMIACIDRALKTYADKKSWRKIISNGMAKDYSWKNSAIKYVKMYEDVSA